MLTWPYSPGAEPFELFLDCFRSRHGFLGEGWGERREFNVRNEDVDANEGSLCTTA